MSTLKRISRVAPVAAGLLLAGACDTLNIADPNDPDKQRVLTDATSVEGLAAGALKSWFNVTQAMDPNGALTTMANNYTASWNNFQMRIYSSQPRVSWQNSLTSTARVEIESFWYGYYAALSSTNDVVYSIRAGLFKGKADSAMVENLAYLLQGLTVGQLALNYDQGFVVDYNSDLSTLPIKTRLQMRDWALAKLDTAIAMASASTYTWPDAWTGGAGCGGGEPRAHAPAPCTNVSVKQIASTMAARLLAYYPRGASETQPAAEWDRVKAYTTNGISSTTPFDFGFVGDGCVKFCDELRLWANDLTTMRTDTRVSHMLDSVTQEDPFPVNNPLTRVTATITGSAAPQTVTPLSMQNISPGRQLAIACAPLDPSCTGTRFVVTGTTATTFTAVIPQSYPAPTTLSAAITKDPTAPQTATPASVAGITTGMLLWIDDATPEAVVVTAVTATTFSAVFQSNHPSGAVVAVAIHRSGGGLGNPLPNVVDLRLGDGTYGSASLAASVGGIPGDATAGTDYAWNPLAIFRPARGQYHQTNIGQIRYDYLGFSAPDGSGGGFGFAPVVLAAENDLVRAEALIRGTAPDLATAATLINKTRVTRGGLPAAAAADGVAGLLAKLQYEQDVELAGDGATPYYNRRRIDGLLPLTPHQMPIPAKELGVLGLPEYTFGGASPAFLMAPSGQTYSSTQPVVNASKLLQDAPRIWNELYSARMAIIKSLR